MKSRPVLNFLQVGSLVMLLSNVGTMTRLARTALAHKQFSAMIPARMIRDFERVHIILEGLIGSMLTGNQAGIVPIVRKGFGTVI